MDGIDLIDRSLRPSYLHTTYYYLLDTEEGAERVAAALEEYADRPRSRPEV